LIGKLVRIMQAVQGFAHFGETMQTSQNTYGNFKYQQLKNVGISQEKALQSNPFMATTDGQAPIDGRAEVRPSPLDR